MCRVFSFYRSSICTKSIYNVFLINYQQLHTVISIESSAFYCDISRAAKMCDVIIVTSLDLLVNRKMADSCTRTRKRGGRYCVAGGPNNVRCTNTSYTEGVSMHVFPKNEEIRKKWTKFVQRHRANFIPSSTSALCSAHFEVACYERNISLNFGEQTPTGKALKRYLKKDATPTIDCAVSAGYKEVSAREKRQVRIWLVCCFDKKNRKEQFVVHCF